MDNTNGDLVPYLERLYDKHLKVIEDLVNSWEKGILTAFKAEFRIDETSIT